MKMMYNTPIILNIESCFLPEAAIVFINLVPETTAKSSLVKRIHDITSDGLAVVLPKIETYYVTVKENGFKNDIS